MYPYKPRRHDCVVVVVVAQREGSEEVYHDSCDIRHVPCLPIDPNKMQLRLAAVHAGRIVHSPVPLIAPEKRPLQPQNGKPSAGSPTGPGIGWSAGLPDPKNEAIYHTTSSKFPAIEQLRCDADDQCTSSRVMAYSARDSNQASGAAGAGFSPQLLLPCSVSSQRQEPHSVEDRSDGWTVNVWEVLPCYCSENVVVEPGRQGVPLRLSSCSSPRSPSSGLNIRGRAN